MLRFPTSDGRRWLSFAQPVERLVANELPEVTPLLRDLEAATNAGHWAVGMVSYDAAAAFDDALVAQRDPSVPLACFSIFDEPARSRGPAGGTYTLSPWIPNRVQEDYEAAVASLKTPIASGETYQVNFTMRLSARFEGDPMGLFASLARAQRADHLAYLDLGTAAVCSASPELFFSLHGTTISTRPMKGTRPRHPDPETDRVFIDDLLTSRKDLAENTMIVDMMRNDLGRIAQVGTVKVPALHTVESYPTVHQMTSTVTAQTDASLPEIFGALFPGASITGAPKVATAHIINDIEKTPRGIYTGSIGAISPPDAEGRRRSEFNIAIRTVWVDRPNQRAQYGVGGGIVWDSEPTSEWLEANDKARILRRADPGLRLLESIAWEPRSGAVLAERHLERLGRSAAHFGFDVDLEEARRLLESVTGEEPAKLRLLVSADGAIELQSDPISGSGPTPWQLPLDTEPVDPTDEFLRHKTTHRARYDEAAARFPDAPDVVLWNTRHEITETTRGNVVVDLDGELVTPPEHCGLLPGTFRAELLANGTVTEGIVALDDLRRADRVFMINSVRRWIPAVVLFDGELPGCAEEAEATTVHG